MFYRTPKVPQKPRHVHPKNHKGFLKIYKNVLGRQVK